MANLEFNVNVEKDAEAFEVLPPGWYSVRIVDEKIRANSAGTGKVLIFTYELINQPGKKITDLLNIINASEKAQAIARACLAKIAESVGHRGDFTSTDILFGRPFEVEIYIDPDIDSSKNPGKKMRFNRVKGYRAYNAGKVPAAPAPAPAPSTPAKSDKAW